MDERVGPDSPVPAVARDALPGLPAEVLAEVEVHPLVESRVAYKLGKPETPIASDAYVLVICPRCKAPHKSRDPRAQRELLNKEYRLECTCGQPILVRCRKVEVVSALRVMPNQGPNRHTRRGGR